MNRGIIAFLLFIGSSYIGYAQIVFNHFFLDKTLRIDYIHTGNYNEENFYLLSMSEEPYWSGSIVNLKDTFNLGNNFIEVRDLSTDKLIFSRGFSNLFWEWRLLPEAKNNIRSFYEVLEIPYPKKAIRIDIFSRDTFLRFKKIKTWYINPNNYRISHDKQVYNFKIDTLLFSGNSHIKVDVVFLAEGYTQSEMTKFLKDAERMIRKLFDFPPFNTHKDDFNFWAVESVSKETGTDDPVKDIWKNTLLNTHFNTFNSNRYLTTTDLRTIHDVALQVPHDQIYVLVNTDKYGGGGVYNYFSLTTVDNQLSELVFVHEFGHAFAGLADEYFYDEDDYKDYYPKNIEPWEPNITSLTQFRTKWKDMIADSIPIPTPNDKKYLHVLGAFEGGGYVSKGIYRPAYSCIMKSLQGNNKFCPVCQQVILRRIAFYCH